jgi:hypothetical protein
MGPGFETPSMVINFIRNFIYTVGPVKGGLNVFENFLDGDFSDTDDIYFEDYDYNVKKTSSISNTNWLGSHAVAVIGYGEVFSNHKQETVKYWICRNSWGEKWGIYGGYFNIACYPHNKICQFEKEVFANEDSRVKTGGFVTCKPLRKKIISHI